MGGGEGEAMIREDGEYEYCICRGGDSGDIGLGKDGSIGMLMGVMLAGRLVEVGEGVADESGMGMGSVPPEDVEYVGRGVERTATRGRSVGAASRSSAASGLSLFSSDPPVRSALRFSTIYSMYLRSADI